MSHPIKLEFFSLDYQSTHPNTDLITTVHYVWGAETDVRTEAGNGQGGGSKNTQ